MDLRTTEGPRGNLALLSEEFCCSAGLAGTDRRRPRGFEPLWAYFAFEKYVFPLATPFVAGSQREDHFSQAELFLQSQSDVEKEHLVQALEGLRAGSPRRNAPDGALAGPMPEHLQRLVSR